MLCSAGQTSCWSHLRPLMWYIKKWEGLASLMCLALVLAISGTYLCAWFPILEKISLGSYIWRKRGKQEHENRSCQVTYAKAQKSHHSCSILLVRASHKSRPDSRQMQNSLLDGRSDKVTMQRKVPTGMRGIAMAISTTYLNIISWSNVFKVIK